MSFALVTADGRLRRADWEHNPELFWALRGGGNFGVVTALEFQLYEVPEVYAGAMFFPWDRSAEVLRAWLDWTRTDRARFYRPDVFHRLRGVKAAYDQDDLFRANHPIPPARPAPGREAWRASARRARYCCR